MTQASLDSPRAKLSRARLHLAGLYDECNAFVNGPKTHSVSYEVESESANEQGREVVHVARVTVLREPPPEWGLLLGDFVQNLRAALDHLVWQFVLLNGARPGRDNQFPICATGTRYWCSRKDGTPSVRDRLLKGVREEHRAGIDAVQPYRAVGGPEQSPLTPLRDLSNADKHRVVQAALTFSMEPGAEAFDFASGADGIAEIEHKGGPLHDGAEILRVRYTLSEPDAKVNMKAQLPIAIGFGKRGVAAEQLTVIYEFVRDLLDAAEPLFD